MMVSQSSTFLRTPIIKILGYHHHHHHPHTYIFHPKPNFVFLKSQKILTPELFCETPLKSNTFPIISSASSSSNIINKLSSQQPHSYKPTTLSTLLGIMILVFKLFGHAIMQGVCKNSNLDQLLTIQSSGILQDNVVGITTHKTLFFAAAIRRQTLQSPHTVVASGVSKCLEVYMALLAIRCALSWFPNIEWNRQPYSTIRELCDPFLLIFRDVIPPLFGTLDVSTTLAFMVLGFLVEVLNATSRPFW